MNVFRRGNCILTTEIHILIESSLYSHPYRLERHQSSPVTILVQQLIIKIQVTGSIKKKPPTTTTKTAHRKQQCHEQISD